MQFSCKKCNTQYTIADEKVRGKVIKVRCKRCNHLIVVRSGSPSLAPGTSARGDQGILQDSSLESEFDRAFQGIYEPGEAKQPPPQAGRAAVLPPGEPEWFYGLDGSEEGPYTLGEMEAKIRTGSVSSQHFIWRDGMSDWVPLEEVPELSGFLTYPGPVRSRRQTVIEPKKQKVPAKKERTGLGPTEEQEKILKQEKEIRQWKLHRRQKEVEDFKKREEERKRQSEIERKRLVEGERKRIMVEERKREEEEERRRRYERDIKEWEKEREEEKEKKRRQEALERKLLEEKERKEREEERQRLEKEEAAKREKEQRKLEAELKRKAEEEKKRRDEEILEQEQEQEQEKKRLEEEKLKQEQEKKRLEEEKLKQEQEKKRLAKEEEERWEAERKRLEQKKKELESKREEEEEEGRREMIAGVLQKRQKVRADRHADRIAEHFFDTGEKGTDESGLLPPPVVEISDELPAQDIADTVQEDFEQMQADPIAVLARRDQPGQSQLSKTTKMIITQAGVASKGRRFGVGLLSVVGVLAILGGAGYLAFSQGWFGGEGSGRLADSVGGSKMSGPSSPGLPVDIENMTPEEVKRYRDALWNIKQPNRPGRPGAASRRTTGTNMPPDTMSSESKELMDFYQSQSEEKREFTPRTPASLVALGQQSISLPSENSTMPDMSKPESKHEVTPVAPTPLSGQRLTDLQVRSVIHKHYHKVKNCLERQLKRDSTISGKLYVVVKVKPNGRVQGSRIATKKFHGTFVEECLLKEVKRWEFPSFKGEAYELKFPLLLTARGEY